MQALLDEFRPGRRIYIPGATGEILALAPALAAAPERLRGVTLVSCPLPGMNSTDYAALHDAARMVVFLPGPYLRGSLAAGKVAALPLSYTGIAAYIGAGAPFDVAIAHVAPKGADGLHSLGVAADFSGLAWGNARRRVLAVNPAMPAMKRGPRIDPATADVIVEVESELLQAGPFRTTPQLTAIAAHVAALVPDGATIQLGIGGAPSVVWRQLVNHRGLVLSSGMVGDDMFRLREAGALRDGAAHLAGIAYGQADFYRALAAADLVAFAGTDRTHDFARLAALPGFTSINAAIEVDLFGQINAEWRGAQLVSGIGGAPDFVRAAAASKGGRSIVALPAAAKGESRIVPRLAAPAVSLARADADTIVTEFGVAELKGKGLEARAEALIAIAAPEHKDGLAAEWAAMRRDF